MCGIVGYTGREQAAPILLEGLSKLEYRGYDSAGVAVRDSAKTKFNFIYFKIFIIFIFFYIITYTYTKMN